MSQGPLSGITVVDLTSYIAGSYAAMMLADLGADVIKVEGLEGDSFRELPGFYGWNRGKRSIAVNLKEPDGRALVHRLARRADVAMENMRPGVCDRLGVGYEDLRAVNPRLIYSSVTAFGPDGPYQERPGFDPLLQAMGGVMTTQGFGGPPKYMRIAVTDYYTAALSCQAILAALFVRERTGRGQHVRTSLLQGVMALQSGSVVDYPGRETVYRDTPTYRIYQAGDGEWFFLAVGNQSFFRKLCQAVGHPEMADDPRFGSWLARRDNGDELMTQLEETFASKPRAEWLRILAEHDIPAAGTQTVHDFMRDPAVLHQKMVVRYDHPERGPLTLMGQPLRFSETQAEDAGPPPTLGQHTDDILHEAGYADAEIADLRRRGVVGGKPPAGARVAKPYSTIRFATAEHVATVTLDRPDVHNAMNNTMREELLDVFTGLAKDDDVRVILVTGAGERAFSAGADIREFVEPMVPTSFRESRKRIDFRQVMDRCPQPIIAAIRGYAFGGGLELALACDMRVAADDAQLGLTEINLAIIPGGGGTQRLPRLVGRGKALEMILTGARISAAEALRIGLVERVVPAADLAASAATLARTIAEKAPIALRYAKEAVVGGLALPLADGLRLEGDLSTLLRTTEDRMEGARAFLEKRRPTWSGR